MGAFNPGLLVGGVTPPAINTPTPQQQLQAAQIQQQMREQGQMAPLRAQQANENIQATDLSNQAEEAKLRQQQEDDMGDKIVQQSMIDHGTNNPDDASWSKLRPSLVGKVNNRILQKYDAIDLEHQKANAALDTDALKKKQDLSTDYGQDIQGLIDTPEDQRQAGWETLVQKAEQNKVVAPGQLQKQVPNIDGLKALRARTAYEAVYSKNAREQALADEATAKTNQANTVAKQAEEAKEKNDFVNMVVGRGDDLEDAEYVKERAKLTPNVQRQMPNHIEGPNRTREQTVAQLNNSVANGYQRLENNTRALNKNNPMSQAIKEANDWAAAQDERPSDEDIDARVQDNYGKIVRGTKMDQSAPGKKQSLINQYLKDYGKAEDAEDSGWQAINQYRYAIQNGNTFLKQTVMPNGKIRITPVTMDTYIGAKNKGPDDIEKSKQAAIDQMKSDSDLVRDRIKDSLNKKYESAAAAGTQLTVPLARALDQTEQGKYKPAAPSKSATTPPAAANTPPSGQKAPQAKAQVSVGQPVKLKDGRTVTVTKVYDNGRFDFK